MNDLPFDQVRNAAKSLEEVIFNEAKKVSSACKEICETLETAANGVRPEIIRIIEHKWQNLFIYSKLESEFTKRVENRIEDCVHKQDKTRLLISLRNIKMYSSILESEPKIKTRLKESIDSFSGLLKSDDEKSFTREEMLHLVSHAAELIAVCGTGMHHYGHAIGSTTGLVVLFLERWHNRKLNKEQLSLTHFSNLLDDLDKADAYCKKVALSVYRVPDFWPKHADKDRQLKHRKSMKEDSNLITADEPISEQEAADDASSMLESKRTYLVSNNLSLSNIVQPRISLIATGI